MFEGKEGVNSTYFARCGWPGRGAHPASHLLQRQLVLRVIPGTPFWFTQITGQGMMSHGDTLAPALKRLWSPHTRLLP